MEPQLMKALLPLAKESRETMLFATADGAKYAKFLAQFMDVEADKLPALIVFSVYPDSLHRPDEQPQSVASMVRAIREIRDGQRSPSSSLQWYQPTRYVRLVERFLRQFSDMQIVALVVAITVTLMALITWCCFPPAQPSSSSSSSTSAALSRAEQAVSSGVKAAGKQMLGAVEVASREIDAGLKRATGGQTARAEAKTAAEVEQEEEEEDEAEEEEERRRETEMDEVTSDEHEFDNQEEEEQTRAPAAVQRKHQTTTTTMRTTVAK
jgi:hypothetical protein